ncbi:MAG: hypothetical protein AUJ92_14800 [Armatimonadetes bacterium CG2_30_59_28]|nr:DUF2520 domain-containing protein [Armatimonadota bacterium]OIO92124.1 MAG: hypothetical protein AUJ92_14800 [Armatimonadetes bacterium CG2_30_59_28]PIU65577.1 MAG: DUF2520 domain-containing protein [Armatimonadetes bacterium CG07_land_8_20_14_0_80_59_28]PIX41553.1 MAG: DUF2520 domain-containing protein [Armatimonadetes bacterium CG_4_8_14_3_um_filter_58_9]PIY39229.1 MAG: DUF2520 domain-containing protein [Armatimonadetes bacterium CG_4_10_14_3_um_filter_59_10]
MTSTEKSLNIIGCGKVGKTLGKLWAESGAFQINDVLNRSIESSRAAVRFVGAGRPVARLDRMSAADVCLIATPDASIPECSRALAASGLLRRGDIVFHCSGALPSREMAAVKGSGALAVSVHPVKTFTDPALDVETFAGTHCGAEGDAEGLGVICDAFERIGGNAFRINPDSKSLYHAASVIVCNYLTALMEVGIQTFTQAGVPRETAMQIIDPIARQTVQNVFDVGAARALTGPIARGDSEVVDSQLTAMREWNPAYAELYRLLGAVALELSREQGSASAENLAALSRILRKDR